MKTITLQTTGVPLKTKEKADSRAKKEGFNSIQDLVRLFLKDYSEGKYEVGLNLRTKSPKIAAALDEYDRGEYIEIDPNQPLSEQLYGDEQIQSSSVKKLQKKT